MIGLNKYLLGALGIVCVTTALLWWRLDAVSADRDEWRETARTNAATVEALRQEAARTDAILTALRETQRTIQEDSARTRRALAAVEANNEAVRTLLDTRLPDDLAGVLWSDGEDRDGSPDPADQPDAAVQGGGP